MFYVCTLEVSAPGGSENLGVHQLHSGLCEPVSNLTRRVSNKTFWIATLQQNYPLHFRKVMARETLGLFKTFEELPLNRGPILSHFGFFLFVFQSEFQIEVPNWFASRFASASRSSLSPLRLFLIHVIRFRSMCFPLRFPRIYERQMLPIKSSASWLAPQVVLSL